MTKKLREVLPEEWELIAREQKNTVFPVEDKKWLFKLCGLYRKGQVHIYLCPIPAPVTKLTEMEPLTESDWQNAITWATRILEELL